MTENADRDATKPAETSVVRCRICDHPIYLHHGAEADFWMHVEWATKPAPHRAEPYESDMQHNDGTA